MYLDRLGRVFGHATLGQFVALIALLGSQTGCWAPFGYHGIEASALPDEFRVPMRTGGEPLNFASLTIEPPKDYVLGADDQLEVTIGGLGDGAELRPVRVQVMASGEIQLPLVGPVRVGGGNLIQAHEAINRAYNDGGFLKDPQVNITLVEKDTTSVLVLGKVNAPGVHILPKYQNDVGHALAAAGGLAEDAADLIEVHRSFGLRRFPPVNVKQDEALELSRQSEVPPSSHGSIDRIPLRSYGEASILTQEAITLHDGDVVVIPSRRHEVFYVVGQLGTTNTVRFTVGDRERELGVGFILPRDREIDVVTAVAMAGYIDPIDSPTTVTVQRVMPDGTRLLILVDLIEARCNPNATVLVVPGDIIYLNPDAPWYMRRTIDRIFPDILLQPYSFFMRRSLVGRGGN